MDRFAAKGVPLPVDAFHAGGGVGELRGPRVAALAFELADPVVAHEAVGVAGQHIGMSDPERPVLEGAEGFGHRLHRVAAFGGPGRVAITQTGLGGRSLRIRPLALLMQPTGPSRDLGQHPGLALAANLT